MLLSNKKIKNKKSIIISISLPLAILINFFLRILNIFILWRCGQAIGDQVLMSGIARSLKLNFNSKIIIITNNDIIYSL